MPYRSVFRPGLFEGQTIIVTGGGSGIGRCTAHELSSLGAHVVLIGRRADKLAATAAEIVEDGGSVDTVPCDIREEEAVRGTVATVIERRGAIQGLVNNAGGQFPAPLEKISQKGFETVVRTNLTGLRSRGRHGQGPVEARGSQGPAENAAPSEEHVRLGDSHHRWRAPLRPLR